MRQLRLRKHYSFLICRLQFRTKNFYQEIVPIIYQHRFITPFIDITLRIMDLEFFFRNATQLFF